MISITLFMIGQYLIYIYCMFLAVVIKACIRCLFRAHVEAVHGTFVLLYSLPSVRFTILVDLYLQYLWI